MLRPQDTSTRERKNLNGLWQFALDPEGRWPFRRVVLRPAGRRRGRWPYRPASTTSPPTPPSATTSGTSGTSAPSGCRAAGRAGGSCCTSSPRPTAPPCGSNDVEVVSHEGGYTPFEADITDHVTPGEEVRITACVNNTLSFQSIPPGVIEDTPAGKRQRYWHDFFNYAGIHRTVWLYATDPAHLTDVTVVTDLDGDDGSVDYTVAGRARPRTCETRVVLRDADGVRGRHQHRQPAARLDGPERAPVGAGRRLPVRPRASAGPRRRRGRQLPPERRRPHGQGRRHQVLDQRRTVLLHRLRQARGHPGDRQGPQRRVPAARLRAAEVDRRQLVPHLALPVLRGRARLRRPAGHRAHRRDRRRRAEHGPRRRDLRRPGLHDLLPRDRERRHPGGPRPGDPRADRPRQEPPQRGAVEHRQRAGVRNRRGRGLLPSAVRRGPGRRPHPPGRFRQRDARARTGNAGCPSSATC